MEERLYETGLRIAKENYMKGQEAIDYAIRFTKFNLEQYGHNSTPAE